MEIGPLDKEKQIPQNCPGGLGADQKKASRNIDAQDEMLQRERLRAVSRRMESDYYNREDIKRLIAEKLSASNEFIDDVQTDLG